MSAFAATSLRPLERAAEAPLPAAWKRRLGTAGGVFLGLVLLVAAWTKALDPVAFAEQVAAEGLDGLLGATVVAFVALALEVGLGLLLVLGVRRLWVLVPAAILVAFFLFLTGRAYWRDLQGLAPAEGCGCFGNLVQRTPAEAFWQDLLLLVPPLALAFIGRARGGRRVPPLRTAAAGIGAAAVAVFAWRAPELPLDDLATRLKPGVEIGAICAGEGDGRVCLDTLAPELAGGEALVVLADLDDPAFGAAVDELNAATRDLAAPALVVVAPATPEGHMAFYWRYGPAFSIREAPAAMLRPLYRRLPRSFRVRDGEVTETYPGLPPGGGTS